MEYLLFLLAGLFRFFRLRQNLFFEGELGHNYLAIKNIIASSSFPLTGPPTSHEWLSFGPLFYWIFGPILALGGYHPIVGALFFGLIGSLVPVLHYYFVKKYISSTAATYSSLLLIASPYLLLITRQSRFFSLVLPLTYCMLYAFFDRKKFSPTKRLVATAFLLGVILNFHLSPVILIPPLLLNIYKDRKLYPKDSFLKALLAFLVPHVPLIVADMQHGFTMLRQVILWFPYRVAGFVGLYPKNTVDSSTALQNIQAIHDFISGSFFKAPFIFGALFILGLGYCVYKATREASTKKRSFYLQLHIFFLGGLMGIFIHGKPPYHYFLPLTPFVFIYAGIAIHYVEKNQKHLFLLKLGIVLLLLINGYRSLSTIPHDTVPFSQQEEIARAIVQSADGKPFALKRTGPDDQFEGDFAQNYRYLLWYYGNEPVEKAETTFHIFEDTQRNVRFEKR